MVYEIEFFLTGLFFILFLSIITIFGFILIFILNKNTINLPLLELFGISLGCGIVFYFLYCYIIESLLFFNFFTILFPIIIFNIIGLVFLFKSDKKIKQKLIFKNIKLHLIKYKNEIFIFLLIFIFIFYFQFQMQFNIIAEYETLLANDPFHWCRNVMYLIDYGHIDYSQIKSYAPGLLFLNGGMISFFPNYRFIYFFHKFVPILYTSLIIFIGFILSRIIFKQKFLIFLSMLGFLTLNYFNYRFLMGLPSAPATILFLIFTITFIDPKIPFYFKGILLAGSMLSHSLLGGVSFCIFFIYIIFHFFSLLISKKESKKIAYKFLKENSFNILIFIGFTSLYLYKLFILIRWYWGDWFNISQATIYLFNFNVILEVNSNISTTNLSEIFAGTFNFDNFKEYFEFVQNLIWYENSWVFLIFFYFFIRIKKKNYKNCGNFIELIKISVVFLILFNFVYYFIIWFLPNNIFGIFSEWLFEYKDRIFEFGAGLFIFMFVFTVHDIYILFSKITEFLQKKFPIYKKFINGNDLRTIKVKIIHLVISTCKIESIVIIFTLFLSFNLYINNRFYYYHTYTDNSFVEMMLTIGEHGPPNQNTNITILLPEFRESSMIELLYRYDYEIIDSYLDYIELIDLIKEKNVSYIIFSIKDTSENVIRYFVFTYEIFYKNPNYIIIKIN